jgi:hypothetical protein
MAMTGAQCIDLISRNIETRTKEPEEIMGKRSDIAASPAIAKQASKPALFSRRIAAINVAIEARNWCAQAKRSNCSEFTEIPLLRLVFARHWFDGEIPG